MVFVTLILVKNLLEYMSVQLKYSHALLSFIGNLIWLLTLTSTTEGHIVIIMCLIYFYLSLEMTYLSKSPRLFYVQLRMGPNDMGLPL